MPGFDENQPRDSHGRWTDGGSAIKTAASDDIEYSDMHFSSVRAAAIAVEKYVREQASEEEVNSAENYTKKKNEVYKKVNSILRGEGDISNYEHFVENLRSFLDKAPKYDGITYRGMTFDTREKYEALKNDLLDDAVVQDKGFMSTSTKRDVIDDFGEKDKPFVARFKVRGKSGVYIAPLSASPEENEVLFPNGKKYKVLSVDENHISGKLTLDAEIEEL